MAKKIYYRLVVPVDGKEMNALTTEAKRLGFKNAHRWAAFKLADQIRKVTDQKK